MSKGIFWFICFWGEDGELSFTGEIISLPVPWDWDGNLAPGISFNSKSGLSNTHKNSWKDLVAKRKDLRRFPWNYFPRGRVQISRGRAFVFMNPIIQECEDYMLRIQQKFHIEEMDVVIKIDNSAHYQCTILEEERIS